MVMSNSDQIASSVTNIPVSVIDKARLWSGRQDIQYAALINRIKQDFHGLRDFYTQMAKYSSTHEILRRAWKTIYCLVMPNARVADNMYNDSIMGPVGILLKGLNGFNQVFATHPEELNAPKAFNKQATQLSASASTISQQPSLLSAPVPQPGIAPIDTHVGLLGGGFPTLDTTTGPPGPPGPAATITIGTTTTGAPGSDTSVTNEGTSSAAILDFTIPQGAIGPTGDTGTTGPQGDTGSSAYQIAVADGFIGSEAAWLASLVGATGSTGATGSQGIQGIQGIQGPTGTAGVATRSSNSITTSTLTNNSVQSGTITLSKTFSILEVTVSTGCRIRLYSTSAALAADASRSTTTPPAAGTAHGVILDLVLAPPQITSFPITWLCSPEAIGSNCEATPSSSISYSITNLSGTSAAISLTFIFLGEET
jgi:hypothetical protein